MPPKFLKLDLVESNINIYINLLKKIKMPFTMECSNYTTKIISQNYNVQFIKNTQSNRTFAAFAKIKSDLKNKEIPVIDMQRNCYYDTAFKGESFYSDYVINVDIKAAYATILFNDGFITRKTYLYLKALPKMDRLVALGMLASRKDILHHNKNGDVFKIEERVSPLSNFFFYCVQKTEHIMQSFKNEYLAGSFLFSWVDGIYFSTKIEKVSYNGVVVDMLELPALYFKDKFNLQITIDILTGFDVELKQDFYKIKFFQSKGGVKNFNIPLPQPELKRRIINYLFTKKYDKK